MKGKIRKLERIARNDPDPARRVTAAAELRAREFRRCHRSAPPDPHAAPSREAPQPTTHTARDASPPSRHPHTSRRATSPVRTARPPATPKAQQPIVFQRATNTPVTGHEPINGYTVHRGDALLGTVWRDASNHWHRAHADIVTGDFDELTPTTYSTRKAAAETLATIAPPDA